MSSPLGFFVGGMAGIGFGLSGLRWMGLEGPVGAVGGVDGGTSEEGTRRESGKGMRGVEETRMLRCMLRDRKALLAWGTYLKPRKGMV